MNKFWIYLTILLGVGVGLFATPNIRLKAAAFWDSRIIGGGMYTTLGVPLKVDADGVVYTMRGSGESGNLVMLETGDFLLLENGTDRILLL
jgi:hypothetical protein